jgi:hypothetical protein
MKWARLRDSGQGLAAVPIDSGAVTPSFSELYVNPAAPRDASDFARSSLTLAVFGLLAGYPPSDTGCAPRI